MATIFSATDIERAARKLGLTRSELCRRAEVAPSTFARWKSGRTTPRLDVYQRFGAVVGLMPAATIPRKLSPLEADNR